MKRKEIKKKTVGGRHKPLTAEPEHGAPPVPMDVLVSQGAFVADQTGPVASPESVATPVPAIVPLLLTAAEVCALLSVSRATFFRMKKAGEVPGCVSIGGQVRYRREDLEQWVKQL